MNILVCSYCKIEGAGLVEAMDVIPELSLSRSKVKIVELGLCEEHRQTLFPTELIETAAPVRRTSPRKPRGPYKAKTLPETVRRKRASAMQKSKSRGGAHGQHLPEVVPDGVYTFTTQQISKRVGRGMKSMGWVLRNAEPSGKTVNSVGRTTYVYTKDELERAGVL